MIAYRKRELGHLLRQTLSQSPVTVISGLRQAGKSTFLQQQTEVHRGRHYCALDEGAWPETNAPPLEEAEVLQGGVPEVALNPEVNRRMSVASSHRTSLSAAHWN